MNQVFHKNHNRYIVIYCLWVALMLSFSFEVQAQNAPPNIILILVDDLGISDLGCYGHPFFQTPSIDSLSERGMRFTQAYAASPVCSPTRAALMTGKNPARLKLTNFLYGHRFDTLSNLAPAQYISNLPLEEATIAEKLKSSGYRTAMIGKWHLTDNENDTEFSPQHRGFDWVTGGRGSATSYFFPEWLSSGRTDNIGGEPGQYLTDIITDEAISFITEKNEKPFFLYLSHYAVHIPLQAPEADIEYFRKIPGREAYDLTYAAMIKNLDDNMRRLMNALLEEGKAENTIIIFTSDNGGLAVPEGGPQPTTNDPYREGKGHLYEGGIRVPLIISWPGKSQQGTESHLPVSTMDIFYTMLEAAGQSAVQADVDGRSLIKELHKPGSLGGSLLYWHYPHFSNQGGRPSAAMRENQYKLIYFFETRNAELYDLEKDPEEMYELSRSKSRIARRMQANLLKWLADVEANLPQSLVEGD
ncbi:MAG: sulfatase [Cyclobacteriaceae bacterium]|nr:sulfatase [Cyclobacteriaceae bacterium]